MHDRTLNVNGTTGIISSYIHEHTTTIVILILPRKGKMFPHDQMV